MARGMALAIGLNRVDPSHYQGWSGPLNACEADARDMAAIGQAQGIRTSVLLTEEARIDAVLAQINQAATSLNGGDLFVLTYSGHGGTAPDINGDEFDDSQDETWCLFDGQLIDDQIYCALGQFKRGVRVFMISDSCHSGTVAKTVPEVAAAKASDVGFVPRIMPPDVAFNTYHGNRAYYDRVLNDNKLCDAWQSIDASVLLIGACQDNQTSLDGTFNGMFTGALLRTWNRGGFQGGYRRFFDSIKARLPADHMPNYFKAGQPLKGFDDLRPFTV